MASDEWTGVGFEHAMNGVSPVFGFDRFQTGAVEESKDRAIVFDRKCARRRIDDPDFGHGVSS